MDKSKKVISWIAAIIAALILLQTLYFKFTAAPESVYIFSSLGLEPIGRIGIGIAELITSILLIAPKTRVIGAIAGIGIMFGAIFSHFTKLGIVVMNDGGYLFILCVLVFVLCLVCLYIEKNKLYLLIKRVLPSK